MFLSINLVNTYVKIPNDIENYPNILYVYIEKL